MRLDWFASTAETLMTFLLDGMTMFTPTVIPCQRRVVPPGPWFADHTEFDQENEFHIARHNVSPEEILAMLNWDPTWRPNKKSGTGEWLAIGRTPAGRALIVVVAWDEARRSVRPIPARDCTASEVRRWIKEELWRATSKMSSTT